MKQVRFVKTTFRYQLTNHLGSASLELDQTAEIITYEEYHPFGTSSYRSGSSETEVSLKRYKYVFKELDNETGLYYYGMRYYAAWIARFVSVDPLQFKYPFYTPFQYAGNKPVSFIDLDGAEPKETDLNFGKDIYLGNAIRVETIQHIFTKWHDENQKYWNAFPVKSFEDVYSQIKILKSKGITQRTIVIESHGSSDPGEIFILPKYDDNGDPINGQNITIPENVRALKSELIGYYIELNKLKTYKEKKNYIKDSNWKLGDSQGNLHKTVREDFDIIFELSSIMDNIDDGGYLIFTSCRAGKDQEGDKLIKGLYELSGGRINIILSTEYVAMPATPGTGMVDTILNTYDIENWEIIGPNTNGKIEQTKNLILKSNGKIPLIYENVKSSD